jgi:hypothetical protein
MRRQFFSCVPQFGVTQSPIQYGSVALVWPMGPRKDTTLCHFRVVSITRLRTSKRSSAMLDSWRPERMRSCTHVDGHDLLYVPGIPRLSTVKNGRGTAVSRLQCKPPSVGTVRLQGQGGTARAEPRPTGTLAHRRLPCWRQEEHKQGQTVGE